MSHTLLPSTEEDLIREWMETRCEVALQDTVLLGIKETGLSFSAISRVKCRIDTNERFPDDSGRTLLHLLLEYPPQKENQAAYASALLEFDADINAQDRNGVTPMMLAVSSATVQPTTFRILLRAPGLSLRLQDRQGRTALFYAIEARRPDHVRLLANEIVHQNHFSVFLLRNNKGETAEDVAERLGDEKSKKIVSEKRIHMLEHMNKSLTKVGGRKSHLHPINQVIPRKRSTSMDPIGAKQRQLETLTKDSTEISDKSRLSLAVPSSEESGSRTPECGNGKSLESLIKKLEIFEDNRGSASQTRVLKSMMFPREVAKALCQQTLEETGGCKKS